MESGWSEVEQERLFIYAPLEIACLLPGAEDVDALQREAACSWTWVEPVESSVGQIVPVFRTAVRASAKKAAIDLVGATSKPYH